MLYIALPVMNEKEYLPNLINGLHAQTEQNFCLVACINQPDSWWEKPEKVAVCRANTEMLLFLQELHDERIIIIDKTSRGKGWGAKAQGVGMARKTAMDYISQLANEQDIIISMDADTIYPPDYLASIAENLNNHAKTYGLSIPYYHKLTGNETLDRAILRYEIYMRAYAVNMWRIGSSYCFTALGSAIALPVWAYRKIGGITPKPSGEDFYLLQTLVKRGPVLHWNKAFAYPSARLSDRVFFGTGPALEKGLSGNWDSYPFYPMQLFDTVKVTYETFPFLFKKDATTPLDSFLVDKFGELPWAKLRANFKTEKHFVRACHEKMDGLRVLQYLKESHILSKTPDSEILQELLNFYADTFREITRLKDIEINFTHSSVSLLNQVRDVLVTVEMHYRKQHWEKQ